MTTRFDIRDWVDHVRGVQAPDRQAQLAALVEAGDPDALAMQRWATSLQEGMHWRLETRVPANVLRRAQALMAQQMTLRLASLPRLLAQLLFDSAGVRGAAGLRSAAASARHCTYEAGEFRIGLRSERLPGSTGLSVIGQIEALGGNILPDCTVVAIQKDRIVAASACSEMGEFQVDLARRGATRLVFELHDRRECIELNLSLPAGQGSSGPVKN